MIEELTCKPVGVPSVFNDPFNPARHTIASEESNSRSNHSLIVYQNVEEGTPPEMVTGQLLDKARVALPAIMNYLYFNPSRVGVVYFGKTDLPNGEKRGHSTGMEDLRIRMIRFLVSEIWPPLLRTDAPDESLGAEEGGTADAAVATAEPYPLAQERTWFLKSLENHMQVLLYLQNGAEGTKYLKVILNNSARRIHFDIIDARESKYRWEMRNLYTRLMDNLETERTIESYEAYLQLFRAACTLSVRYASVLDHPADPLVPVTVYGEEELRLSGPFARMDVSGLAEDMGDAAEVGDAADGASACSSIERRDGSAGDCSNSASDAEQEDGQDFAAGLVTGASIDVSAIYQPLITYQKNTGKPNTRAYLWMESLQKPESSTLDYKSYFSDTACEIKHRCVKFMCGFLNAYREGRLVIGVHEIPRRDEAGNVTSDKKGRETIITHNDLVDQYVVGVRMTELELEDVQLEVSEALRNCIPPVPPACVNIDVVPIHFPEGFTYSQKVLVLYEDVPHSSKYLSRDSLKQKSNFAIRFLHQLDLAIVPLDLQDEELLPVIAAAEASGVSSNHHRNSLVPHDPHHQQSQQTHRRVKAEAFAIAAVKTPESVLDEAWVSALDKALRSPKSRCQHAVVAFPERRMGPLMVPPLHIVEISVDLARCGCPPLTKYKGKFFTGWPSIPIWDVATRRIRRVERNCALFADTESGDFSPDGADGSTSRFRSLRLFNHHRRRAGGTASDGSPIPLSPLVTQVSWYDTPQLASLVLAYLYDQRFGIDDILRFRLVHPVCNLVFENRQGTELVDLLYSDPAGGPQFSTPSSQIARMQFAFLSSHIPPLPLLLCRVYEILGGLHSPYPYVFVPIVQQSFRVSPFLIPIYYRQHYFDGQMRLAVVFDLRDGFLKTMELHDGNLQLRAVVGVGFERMNRKQVYRQLERERGASAAEILQSPRLPPPAPGTRRVKANFLANHRQQPRNLRLQSRLNSGRQSSSMLSPMTFDSSRNTPRDVEAAIPILHFSFHTRDADPAAATRAGWTLQHLLSWLAALAADRAHVRPFGYCDRSIAFYLDHISSVCEDDVDPAAVANLRKHLTFSSPHNCFLHKKVKEWRNI